MSTTLSYGYVQPASGDKGSVFWQALEDDIQQLNDHSHDGIDSAKLTALASDAVSQNILAAAWVDLGEGSYRQLVTVPTGFTVDLCTVSFRESVTGDYIHGLRVTKASATTYYVYINDNSLSLKAVYTT